ncbi:MAG: hypothetical protein KZQ76_08400 [Candidatus Thiodiazotropha sp. (ex Epidulcina cf. delphinae)]|nr:hypothetical protein [Candidatus Thiodiazotropha sp. (ex Epidulcina cf. delphinae)]
MTNLINLGCGVSDIHRRYAEIHKALFGVSSYRMILYALQGKIRSVYSDYEHRLDDLQGELAELERQIHDVSDSDLPMRSTADLYECLTKYTGTLRQVIAELKSICSFFKNKDKAYQDSSDADQSRLNRDKVAYDYSIRELERLGTKLNKLFSGF